MTATKKILSAVSVILLVSGFIIVIGAPGQTDVFGGSLLNVFRQLGIGFGVGGIGVLINALLK